MGESGSDRGVVERRGNAFCAQLVLPIAGGIGTGICADRDHAEWIGRAWMGVADLRFGPPPAFGQSLRGREICYRAANERIHLLGQDQPPVGLLAPGGDLMTVGASRFKSVSSR